jgi:NAD(P)-dependent dehydrogenase (short-subunit alcohol dehydrogenase family)
VLSRASSAGKVILITGASAGIGRATADELARRGWTVCGGSRRGTGSGPHAASPRPSASAAASWTPFVLDVDDDESVHAAIDRVVDEHGRLDAVVACAGWGLAGAVEQTPLALAKEQVETNFWGAARVVQAALPVMRRQGGGRVVLVSSIGGIVAIPFQAFYSAGKFALEGYGEALAYEVAPFGIAVTLVEPGNVRTEFTQNRRNVVPPKGDDPYAVTVAHAIDVMARDETNGIAARDVAKVIVGVLDSRHPRRRVSVGKSQERVGIIAKRLMPFRLFEQAAKGSLGV